MNFHPGFATRFDKPVAIRPWRFERDFAAVPMGAENCDAETPVAVLKSELAALQATQTAEREAARAPGYAEGLADAAAGQQNALLSAIDALQAAMEDAAEWRADRERALSGDAAELALAAAVFLAGTATGLAPARTIEAALSRVMQQLPRGEEVRLFVHPDLVAPMETHLAFMQSQDRRRLAVQVIADPALTAGDARFDWHGGGMELDAGLRRAAIARELQALLTHTAPAEDKPVL